MRPCAARVARMAAVMGGVSGDSPSPPLLRSSSRRKQGAVMVWAVCFNPHPNPSPMGGGAFTVPLSARKGTFAVPLSAGGGAFSAPLSARKGTFAVPLSAGGGVFSVPLSAREGAFAVSLSAGGGVFSVPVSAREGAFPVPLSAGGGVLVLLSVTGGAFAAVLSLRMVRVSPLSCAFCRAVRRTARLSPCSGQPCRAAR